MEFVHVGVPPSNYCTDDPPLHATALVDMGALHLRLPWSLARQMDLPFDRFRRVTHADGRSMEAPYVGPIRIEVGDRECFVGAMVFGDEVLLGAIPMEDMDVLADPARRKVVQRAPQDPSALPSFGFMVGSGVSAALGEAAEKAQQTGSHPPRFQRNQ